MTSHNTQTTVRFYLDGRLHEVTAAMPTTMVLDYLREQLQRTGSKEGCAEGDCGACTVVVAELHAESYRLRPLNACIQFLPTLDGKELLTVESLCRHTLHPVQQALVDEHGSQCGFCTPGFVMSLFYLYKTQTSASREQIDNALSGNLCRCTGYRPIISAASKMYEYASDNDSGDADWKFLPGLPDATLVESEQDLLRRLRAIQRDKTLHIKSRQEYFAPTTVQDLAELLHTYPDATVLAGGTDVGLWVTKQFKELPVIIYLGDVSALYSIDDNTDYVEIGAAVNLHDAYQAMLHHHPGFKEIFRRFASVPIRSAGTLVGNVANGSPIGDSMPGLISLGAELVLMHAGQTRILSLDEFYLGYQENALLPGEFVYALRLPKAKPQQIFRSYKISKRFDQDISAVCAAFSLTLEDNRVHAMRICYGGMAAIPQRAKHCEHALSGKHWTMENVDAALSALQQDFSPMTDMRASSRYRELIAANLLKRFHLESSGAGHEPRVFEYQA